MRVPRLLLSLLVIGLPVATVAVTAESASADPFTYTAIASTVDRVCAISNDHTLVCWGANHDGYLIGRRTADPVVTTPTPIPAPNGESWTEVSPAQNHVCAVTNVGHAYCWGEYALGNLFTPSSRTPVRVEMPNDRRVHSIKSSYSNSCAIDNDTNGLWCWGDARTLGDGNTETVRVPAPVPLPDGGTVGFLESAYANTCVISSLHNMYCWGDNQSGEFGLGYWQSYNGTLSWTPVLVPAPSGTTWKSVSVGLSRICGIASDDNGYCSGDNYNGSFGDNTYNDSANFRRMVVPNNDHVSLLMTSMYHTCIFTDTQRTWCAGEGSNGQLGSGTTLGGKTWREPLLPSRTVVSTLALTNPASCFLTNVGSILCTGFSNSPIWYPTDPQILVPSPLMAVGTPTVSTATAGTIGAESVALGGIINPNGSATTARIEISSTSDFVGARSVTIAGTFESGFTGQTWSTTVDVAPRTTYRVRVIAVNGFGATTSSTSTFTSLGTEPVLSVPSFSDITGNEATASFTVDPGRLLTTARLEYSTDPTFDSAVTVLNLPDFRGASPVPHQVMLSGLDPRTDHHVRIVATNRLGTTVSGVAVLHTVGDAPTVDVQSLTNSARTISVTALVDPGLAAGTVRAELSTDPAFSSIVRSSWSRFTSREHRSHSFDFQGLSPRSTYHVRIVATNGVGSAEVSRTVRTNGGAPRVSLPVIEPQSNAAVMQIGFDANALATLVKVRVSENAAMTGGTEYFIYAGDAEGAQTSRLVVGGLDRRTDYWVTVTASNPDGIVTSDPVRFTTLTPIGVMINGDDDETASTSVELSLNWPAGTVAIRVANNASFKWARVMAPVSLLAWELAATADDEDYPDSRSVWVEFIGADGSRSTHFDEITLLDNSGGADRDAPVVTLARGSKVSVASASVIGSKSARTVKVSVSDRRSGVNRVEVRSNGRVTSTKVEPLRRAVYAIALPKGNGAAWVRVLDVVGHASKWIRIR